MKRNLALILLFDSKKRILLQHRSEDAAILPGYWAFFGGGIEEGESPEEAVKRESLEELNYPLKNPQLLIVQDFKELDIEGTMYVFIEEYDGKTNLELNEGQDMKWFKLSETKKLKMIDHDRKVIEYIKGKY